VCVCVCVCARETEIGVPQSTDCVEEHEGQGTSFEAAHARQGARQL